MLFHPDNRKAQEHPCHQAMLRAVEVSRNGFGRVAPNPCVGALLLKNGDIVAEGWHHAYGQEHAERVVLKEASIKGIDPAGCLLVVTLEPCAHQGKTPPCVDAVLEAGIKHVVIGALDPNPVASGGAEILRDHGVKVETGIAERECLDNIADFICWRETSRPYIILKLASTLDGRIATRSGDAKWITSEEARAEVHQLRSCVQAVLVGGNTFYQDNPALDCRLENQPRIKQPLPVVVTSRLPDVTADFKLLRSSGAMFLTSIASAASPKAKALREFGVTVEGLEPVPPGKGKMGGSLHAALNLLPAFEKLRANYGCHHLLCEGGGSLGLFLLEQDLVDEFHLHLAPKIIGDNSANPLFDGHGPDKIADVRAFRFTSVEERGGDLIVKLRPKRYRAF